MTDPRVFWVPFACGKKKSCLGGATCSLPPENESFFFASNSGLYYSFLDLVDEVSQTFCIKKLCFLCDFEERRWKKE